MVYDYLKNFFFPQTHISGLSGDQASSSDTNVVIISSVMVERYICMYKLSKASTTFLIDCNEMVRMGGGVRCVNGGRVCT